MVAWLKQILCLSAPVDACQHLLMPIQETVACLLVNSALVGAAASAVHVWLCQNSWPSSYRRALDEGCLQLLQTAMSNDVLLVFQLHSGKRLALCVYSEALTGTLQV